MASRQYKYQQARIAEGKCRQCGTEVTEPSKRDPAKLSQFCPECRQKKRVLTREHARKAIGAKRRNNSLSYKIEQEQNEQIRSDK